VASDEGYSAKNARSGEVYDYIYLCPGCTLPTFFLCSNDQHPAPLFRSVVGGDLPDEIAGLYNEARKCVSVQAYTCAVMACRKLLMNIAHAKGAPPNRSFAEYVDFLCDNGYVPPGGKPWVTHIRAKGNDANHEIPLMTEGDAKLLIRFAEMLLKFIYELPAQLKAHNGSAKKES